MFLAFLPVTQVGSWLYAVVYIKVNDKVQWIADFHVGKLKDNKNYYNENNHKITTL